MKYYKVINALGWSFTQDKIYPEDYRDGVFTVKDAVTGVYSKDFEEVPAGDYFVQEGEMPEYFAIKRVADNPLWGKYIDWLNTKYSKNIRGEARCFYGYAGFSLSKTDMYEVKLSHFKNNPVELTLEQWDKIINKTMEEKKEIIGWKLKDSCEQYTTAALNIINQSKFYIFAEGYNFSTNSTNAIDLKKAGVLELWFEPVYSQRFKVGDWITIENSKELQPGCRGCKKGTYNIISKPVIDWSGLSEDDNGFFVKTFDEVWKISNIGVRLATSEEIKVAQILKFGGYGVTFGKVTSGFRITCNGETGTFSQLEHIYNTILKKEKMMFGGQEVKEITYSDDTLWSRDFLKATATSIKIGCTTGTWDEFVAIYKKAKSML